LRALVATAGGMAAGAANSYVDELIKNHRYVPDVY
jgi:sulfite reductase alpha subunit-like flavoprotein